MAGNLGDLVVTVSAGLDPLRKGLNSAAGMVESFGRSTAKSFGSMLSDPLRNMKPALTVAAGLGLAVGVNELAGGVRDVVGESVRLAAAWEKSSVQMGVLLGGADKARDMLRDLREFSAESPLSLKDSISEATKLLAAGVKQDQISPTLRMLSDLAMGDRLKFSRASLAYSQIKATGHVQGDELNQLRELGIPIVKAIADAKGVLENDVAGLVSRSEVSFRDVVMSMKAMTSEGGQFFDMTRKGANTLEGQFERLTDAADELKRDLGRAIIEEAGLLDATKDGTRFLDRMKANVNDLRPAIRFVADGLKAGAQIGGELLKNGPLFARAFSEGFREANPNASRLLDKVGDLVRQAKSFKLDPILVVDAAVDVASAFGTAFDGAVGSLMDGLKSVHTTYIRPITDDLKTAADAWRAVSDPIKKMNRIGENMEFSEDQFRSRIYADPAIEGTNAKLARLGFEFKNTPDGAEKDALKGKYATLNRAMHDAIGKQLDAELLNQRILLHEHGRKAIGKDPTDIIPARVELAKLNTAALDARLNLEKSLYGSTDGPAKQLGAAFGLDKLRDKVRGMAREFAARDLFGDPAALNVGSIAGGLAGLATSLKQKPKTELLVPELAASNAMRDVKLPTAAEFGSQQAAEIFAQIAGRLTNPQLEESTKQTAILDSIDRGIQRTVSNLEQNVGPILPAP